MINLNLDVNEVNALLNVLGSQPSHTGVFPLMMKIHGQANAQVAPQPEAPVVVPAEDGEPE